MHANSSSTALARSRITPDHGARAPAGVELVPAWRRVGGILHVSTARTWRGGEQQLAYLAERLASAGVPQLVVCAAGSALERACRARSVDVVAVTRRFGVDPLFAWALAREARRRGPAVVHAHDAHAHAAAVLAAAVFGLAAPIVVHRRVDFGIGGSAWSRWKYRHPAVRRILCVSHAIAGIVRRDVGDDDRIRVVHDGIDLARFAPGAPVPGGRPQDALRRAHGIPAGVPLIGNVAALVDHKDHVTFVETAARLLAGGLDARFVVVGEGPLRADLEALAAARGLAGRLVFAGFRDDVPEVLRELDAFLFTSKEEGLGSSIVEAFAAGVPVVATRAGGIPELVEDGVSGLLAPIRDPQALAGAVRRVLEDAPLRRRLVEGAARRARALTADRMAAETLALYDEVAPAEGAGAQFIDARARAGRAGGAAAPVAMSAETAAGATGSGTR